jgi:hypothetical protein
VATSAGLAAGQVGWAAMEPVRWGGGAAVWGGGVVVWARVGRVVRMRVRVRWRTAGPRVDVDTLAQSGLWQ